MRWPAGLDAGRFVEDYWQRRPLLLRGALPDFARLVDGDDLAALALDPSVEARLVLAHGDGRWELRHGPFEEAVFAALPTRGWTLLVQDVDKHLPPVAEVLSDFRFLPDWRLDDVMISYAAPGGSVGPHVDDYDVFLLQAAGRRRWSLDPAPAALDLVEDLPLRILRRFTPTEHHELDGGDLLYLPPGVAHHGVGDAPAVTWSIGFRAPAAGDLLRELARELDDRSPTPRYTDPDLGPDEAAPGRIGSAAVRRAGELLEAATAIDPDTAAACLGRAVTRPKPWLQADAAEERLDVRSLTTALRGGARLRRHPWTRIAWRATGDGLWLFADGERWRLPPGLAPLARQCADGAPLGSDELTALVEDDRTLEHAAAELLAALHAQGSLVLEAPAGGANEETDMTPVFQVRVADWERDAGAIRKIREAVFVVEQSVDPELEWDGLDAGSIQAVAEDENRDAIATGRLHPSGKIGRMAVMPSWRGRGVGAAIMQCLIEAARQGGLEEVYLHAQSRVVGFYARFGFEAEGDEFDEAGIPHRFMRRRLADN